MGLVKDADVRKVTVMDNIEGGKDVELPEGWDAIDID